MKHDIMTIILLDKIDYSIDDQGYILNSDGDRIEALKVKIYNTTN